MAKYGCPVCGSSDALDVSEDDPDIDVDDPDAPAHAVYHYLGIPTDLFTPVFSVSRMAGWTAHIMEQHADNRLIRPESEYLGERDLTWQPLGER